MLGVCVFVLGGIITNIWSWRHDQPEEYHKWCLSMIFLCAKKLHFYQHSQVKLIFHQLINTIKLCVMKKGVQGVVLIKNKKKTAFPPPITTQDQGSCCISILQLHQEEIRLNLNALCWQKDACLTQHFCYDFLEQDNPILHWWIVCHWNHQHLHLRCIRPGFTPTTCL